MDQQPFRCRYDTYVQLSRHVVGQKKISGRIDSTKMAPLGGPKDPPQRGSSSRQRPPALNVFSPAGGFLCAAGNQDSDIADRRTSRFLAKNFSWRPGSSESGGSIGLCADFGNFP
jgi:hypothetical protein